MRKISGKTMIRILGLCLVIGALVSVYSRKGMAGVGDAVFVMFVTVAFFVVVSILYSVGNYYDIRAAVLANNKTGATPKMYVPIPHQVRAVQVSWENLEALMLLVGVERFREGFTPIMLDKETKELIGEPTNIQVEEAIALTKFIKGDLVGNIIPKHSALGLSCHYKCTKKDIIIKEGSYLVAGNDLKMKVYTEEEFLKRYEELTIERMNRPWN